MRWARRISQILFFLLFIVLFFSARFPYEQAVPADLFLRSSPLVAIATMLSSRTFIHTTLLAFAVLLLTIPLGRFFCGWICPLGTVIDGSDRLFERKKSKPRQRPSTRFRAWKFAVLIFVLFASLFSVQFIWFFDPIALLTRTLTVALYPIFSFALKNVFDIAFRLGIAEDQLYAVFDVAQSTVLPLTVPTFFGNVAVLMIFGAILALGAVSRRFWCRNLCPLGALLGIFSRFRLTKRYVSEQCTQCGMCQRDCRMNAIEDDYTVNNTVECIECAECVAVCPPQAIAYKFGRNKGKNEIDLSRRRFIQASVAGALSVTVVKTAALSRSTSGDVIRPPGALEEHAFLDRCIRCQECTKICSSTGACLQPAVFQSGWEGFWTPVVVPRLGYCEYNCNLCGLVCPTGAIQKFSIPEKQKLKMGTAYFDKSRCIPWYNQNDCLVCEEHCPTPDKAIKFDIREARTPDGGTKVVKFPYVDEDLCVGCGICENKCPVVGKPGIFVTRANERRTLPCA